MAAAGSEQKDLLALIHQHLVQIGYGKAARELLLQSGQKSFPSSPVLLRDIFTQWKKTSSQTQKQVPDDHKRDAVAKIRVPDPKSSSESEEEEVAKPIATNLSVNNRSTAKAESSSEDEDSSSEEEAVAEKTVKTPVAGNKTANFLQLAAQKSNSVPGKGVAVAAVQARGKPTKVVSSQQPLPAVAKTKQQNKVLSGKSGPLSLAGQSPAQAAAAKKASSSESSSSSSSSVESEEEKTLTVSKTPAATQALKKAESSSEDSSDDSEEEATNTAATQIKPAVHSAQVNKTPTKSSLATAVASKVSPAQATVNQPRGGFGSPAGRAKPAESSETSDSSDSEDDKPASIQAKLLGKTPQALASPVKNAPSALLSKKAVHTPTPLKQAAKPSGTDLKKPGLLSPAKTAGSAKETESSESSSSESEASPVPISQKRLQTPQPPTAAKQSLADKPGPPVKAASSALKGKDSESSSSSDSEDETFPATANLPPPSATKRNATAVLSGAKKLQPSSASHQKAQESEDSSEDSSDDSGSEEDTVFTQKPAQVAQKPGVVAAKTPAAKAAGAKAGNVQSAGKGATTPGKSAAASLQEEPESSETDSSDSSESEEEGKQVKQAPARSLFKQQTPSANAAIPSGKGLLTNSTVSDSVSSKCQGKGPAATPRKVEQSPSKKAKLGQSQAQPAKHAGILNRKESSGSSSSSDSEAEAALTTAKGIARPGMLQKQGAIKEAESSSEESSDEEDQEPSQSLLTGYPGLLKTSTPAVPKSAASVLSKQTSRKAATVTPVIGAFAKSSEKAALCDSSSSDSSDSDTDAEKTPAVQKPEFGSLPSSGREAVVAKRAVGAKTTPGNIGSLASPAKKARKAQSNGKAKGTAAKHIEMPPSLLPVAHPEGVGSKSEEVAATQGSGAGAQGDMQATPCAATKAPKTPKSSKAGLKEKPLKKRKLAAGDAGVGEQKGKKLKVQSGLEVPKKKKKKSKCSSSIKSPKEKEGKEKKSKKKKSKKLESLASDASQKKKKKKKKTGDLEGAA